MGNKTLSWLFSLRIGYVLLFITCYVEVTMRKSREQYFGWHESIYSFISMIYFYIYWYQPSSCHWSFASPPKNIRKPLACWCLQGVRKSLVTWNGLTNLRSMINSHIETSQLFVSFKSIDWFLFGGTLTFKCFEKIKKNIWTGYLCNIFVKFYKMIHRNDTWFSPHRLS